MYFAILALLALILLPLPAATQEVQPATTGAPFTIVFESIRLTQTGFMATVSFLNTLPEPLQLTLTYPQDKTSFAADNLGNEYTLANATGMMRQKQDPNIDLAQPSLSGNHSTFLLTPPNQKAMASYQFKRTGEREASDKPTSLTISIGLYARPAKDFKPLQEPQRTFTFTATITDAKVQ